MVVVVVGVVVVVVVVVVAAGAAAAAAAVQRAGSRLAVEFSAALEISCVLAWHGFGIGSMLSEWMLLLRPLGLSDGTGMALSIMFALHRFAKQSTALLHSGNHL